MGFEDVQYRATFDIDEVLSGFDIIDQRAVRSAERVRQLSTQAQSARARGLASERQAIQASFQAEERQRREAYRVAQQLYRDQEREAKRSAKEEEKAFVAAFKAEERQRREAAALARQLRRDEERDLKAFGDRMRRETRERYAEQARLLREAAAAQKAAGAGSDVAGALGLGGLATRLAPIVVATAAIAGLVRLLEEAASAAYDLAAAFIKTGIESNAAFETMQVGLASLIANFYELRDASGQILTGPNAIARGVEIAAGEMKKLQIAAIQTKFTTAELGVAYQQALGGFAAAGVPLEQVLDLTVRISQAAGAIGIEGRQLNEEIRSLATGNISVVNSRLATALGITGAMVREWKAQGTLVEELTRRTEVFAQAGGLAQKSLEGLSSSILDAFQAISRDSTSQLYDSIKASLSTVFSAIFDSLRGEYRPEIQALVETVDNILGQAGDRLESWVRRGVAAFQDFAALVVRNEDVIGGLLNAALDVAEALVDVVASLAGAFVDVSRQIDGSRSRAETFRGSLLTIQRALRTIADILQFIVRVINAMTAAMNVFVGTVRISLGPLSAMASLLSRVVGLQAVAASGGGESLGPVSYAGSYSTGSGSQGLTGSEAAAAIGAQLAGGGAGASPRGGGGGGGAGRGGGGGSRKREIDEGAKVLAQLQQENALLREGDGYDQAKLRLVQQQEDSLARISELLTQHKISTEAAATANRLIHDQLRLQTAELDRQARESLEKVRYDQTVARLKLDKDEYGLMRYEAQEANKELQKRLERELGHDRQLEINALVRRDLELRIAEITKLKDERAIAARKEIVKLLEDESSEIEKQGDIIQENLRRQVEAGRDRINALREQNYADLKQLFGEGGVKQSRSIQETADALTELGITMRELGELTGFVATNLAAVRFQIQALKAAAKGDVLGSILASIKAATAEVLLSVGTFQRLGEAIGNALLGNANSIKEFGKFVLQSILQLIGQISIQLGTMLILVGLGLSAVPFLFGLSGGAAIAAGAALVAFGVAMTAAATVVGGSSQGGAAGAAGGASETSGGSNVQDIGQARERRIRRREFNTSGESRERRPFDFVPGVGGQDALHVEIDLNLNGGDDVANALISKHEIVTVSGLSRGKVRTKVRKRVA